MKQTLDPATLWRMLAVLLLLVLLWRLRGPAMLLFGAVLVAAALRALAEPLAKATRSPPQLATALVVLALALLLGLGLWALGAPLSEQLQALRSELPRAWFALRGWLDEIPLGGRLLAVIDQMRHGELPWENIAGLAGYTVYGLSLLALIVLMGLYLAFDVYLYRNGIVRLFPLPLRGRIGDALDAAGHALTRWLLGQAVTMLLVGAAVAIGLTLLKMPMSLALGVITGVLEFVPFFGPIAAGLLAVLIAFVEGPQQALYVATLFLVIQQLEGNLLVPLVQRWAVQLPPVLVLVAVLIFGQLFGLAGVVFATPLMVVVMVLVQRLYVEQTLEAGPP